MAGDLATRKRARMDVVGRQCTSGCAELVMSMLFVSKVTRCGIAQHQLEEKETGLADLRADWTYSMDTR